VSSPGTLEHRLASCLPAATVELEAFCRLAGVVESDEVETAAMECRVRPRLLLNPAFVAEHCQRDEHLFLLVMHEIWHVVLAHTRLYPNVSEAHNIAFDAVINATLARQYPEPPYRGFLERVNPADVFPACLLRPPEGWPRRPRYPRCGPRGTAALHRRLYPPLPDWLGLETDVFAQPARMRSYGILEVPGYEEILDLLERAAERAVKPTGGVTLLGDHERGPGEALLLDDPVVREAVRVVTKDWGSVAGTSPGLGGALADLHVGARAPGLDARTAFARVLRNALGPPGAATWRVRTNELLPAGLSVLPAPGDRSRPARERLGVAGLLWTQQAPLPKRRLEREAPAHVYLDVSGSMATLLPRLLGLLVPCVRSGRARVFQFSTRVEPLTLQQLQAGKITTTGGTRIACVLEHALATPRLRRAIVLTDGFTGTPTDDRRRDVARRQLLIHAVFPAESPYTGDLAPIARTTTILPPLTKD
jgi:hypothetical protein